MSSQLLSIFILPMCVFSWSVSQTLQLCANVHCAGGSVCDWHTGQCQTVSETCPGNSHFTSCGSPCPPTCDRPQPRACPQMCVVGCQCDEFFLQVTNRNKSCVRPFHCPRGPQTDDRDKCETVSCAAGKICVEGKCEINPRCPQGEAAVLPVGCHYVSNVDANGCPVPTAVCPGQRDVTCGANSLWSTCASGCPRTCWNRHLRQVCSVPCQQGCVCSQGYVFSSNDTTAGCVYETYCPSSSTAHFGLVCGENEEVKECGACDQFCGRNRRLCSLGLDCRHSPECGCISHHKRNSAGVCVPESRC